MNAGSQQITQLLVDWNNGNGDALESLMPLVYGELRQMARRYMSKQPSGHTLQTTELIHETYLKLAGNEAKDWKSRAHFFGVAAQAMRHILVDYARARATKKRGANPVRISLDRSPAVSPERASDIIALDDALNDLERLDKRKSRVVELKFFGGLTIKEIAEVVGVSKETVKRDWQFSRVWLQRELSTSS